MSVKLSVIVPLFNEEANVSPLVAEVARALADTKIDFELVLVDDASKDATWARIQEARAQDPRVRGIRHERNAGQSAALWTGITGSESPLIATLDGDLQNDPADLPRMLQELETCDFVCGMRLHRQDSGVRKMSSAIARWARKAALGADFRDTGCAMRVFKRESLQGLFAFNGLHRFLPILVHGGGFKTREVPVNHRPRVAGVSKYGIGNRLWRGLFDLVGVAWFLKRRIRPQNVTRLP